MNYRPLYSLRVEHDYFDRGVCRALRCRISPTESALWHRRGLLLRRLGENEWTILYDSEGAGMDTSSDVLVLEMEMADPAFVLYTQWEGFRPASAYGLALPVQEEMQEAVRIIREVAPKRKTGSGFCRIEIRMTEALWQAAQEESPQGCTLRFHAPQRRWEYLVVPRGGDTLVPERFVLEEVAGKLHFSPFEPVRIYGKDMLRTVSEEAVPMRERYDVRLKLVSPAGNTGRKQTLLRHIDPPEPGRFMDVEAGLLRQMCSL